MPKVSKETAPQVQEFGPVTDRRKDYGRIHGGVRLIRGRFRHGGFSWFLLALHVRHRTYPISYDKWIREQVVENLGLPELYARLPALFELHRLESRELEVKAADLRALVETYIA
jgi:hypothetical protein